MSDDEAALELVRYIWDAEKSEPCDHDHHGYCQAHTGGFRVLDDGQPECWIVAASRLLAR